jgi:hypothetical protein
MHSRLSRRRRLQSNCRQPRHPLPLCFDAAVPRRRPSFEDPLLKQPRRQPVQTWKTSFNARLESLLFRGTGGSTKRENFCAQKNVLFVVRALSHTLSFSLLPLSLRRTRAPAVCVCVCARAREVCKKIVRSAPFDFGPCKNLLD